MTINTKRQALQQLLNGNAAPARSLRKMVVDLDQFTTDELKQLYQYQLGRGDDLVDPEWVEKMLGRPIPMKREEKIKTLW